MKLKSERVLVPLSDATAATCGGKAGTLGVLLRAGLPVPDGFVVPLWVHRAAIRTDANRSTLPTAVLEELKGALPGLGGRVVAVRSSAADEDTPEATAAGQYDSTLGVRGVANVTAAILACWTSLHSARATAYRTQIHDGRVRPGHVAMAVLVQRHLDAEVAGVLFTPTDAGAPTVIEASWGLGTSVVAGTVTPDIYRVHPDGNVRSVVADKPTRLDRGKSGLRTTAVPAEQRSLPTLGEATTNELAALGSQVAAVVGAPQDIEWAIAGGRLWVLQSRPITVAPPSARLPGEASNGRVTLRGTAGSDGTAIGIARTVAGPSDFSRVRPGDILICPFTDPAWTPLLGIVAGVVTETGGLLCHAAIVAREHRIPAVLGVPRAMTLIHDGVEVTIDGTAGTVVA